LLSVLVTHVGAGDRLWLDYQRDETRIEVGVTLAGTRLDAQALSAEVRQQEALGAMISALEATLSSEYTPEGVRFCLTMHTAQRTVLVIDDNPDVAELLRRYVANHPFRVITATSGDEGIALAQSMRVDVILLDIMLPGQDGYEVLQTLKNQPLTQHIPIVICSVIDGSELAHSLGADGYLKKPPGQADMLKELGRWLA
jgi:CheY-like chemotaxis protein